MQSGSLFAYGTVFAHNNDDDLLDRGPDVHPGSGQNGWYAAEHDHTAPGEMVVLGTTCLRASVFQFGWKLFGSAAAFSGPEESFFLALLCRLFPDPIV